MQQDKWNDTVNLIKDTFSVEDAGKEELDDIPNGTVEFIVFAGPLGRMKLEYMTKPVVLNKKALGSRRIGSEATVQYTYSDTEFSNTFTAYKWDDVTDEWVEMAPEAAGAFSI